MKDLPALYAAVCAKRPELAVKWLSTTTNKWAYDHPPITVFVFGITSTSRRLMMDYHAAALILARWVEELPCGYKLSKQDDHECEDTLDGEMWWVEDYFHEKHEGFARTPLEALAAFYMEYAK